MAKSEAVTGICLHQLVAREEAVIKRVIAFSSAQGRNYQLTELQNAQIVVVSDETPVDFARLNPEGCMIARIAAADSAQPYDVLMARPLLVTKVMRTLDEAGALLQESLTESGSVDTEVLTETESETTKADDVVSEVSSEAAETDDVPEADGVTALDTTPKVSEAEQVDPDPESAEEQVSSSKSAEQADPDADVNEASLNSVEALPAEVEPVASAPESVVAGSYGTFQYTALVVDDSAAIRKQLELELRDAGIGADFAEDGEQAMEKVAANRYDLIFLDIIMPGIDGYETCRQMRLREELKKTPIIMLSAKTSPLDEVQGVIAGASTYLTKPVKSEQLQNTLKRVSMWIDNFQATT